MKNKKIKLFILLLIFVLLSFYFDKPIFVINGEKVLYGFFGEVFLTNGLGNNERKVLAKIDNKSKIDDRSFSIYSWPCINKEGSKFICLNEYFLRGEKPDNGQRIISVDLRE